MCASAYLIHIDLSHRKKKIENVNTEKKLRKRERERERMRGEKFVFFLFSIDWG